MYIFKVDFKDEVYVSGLATQGFYNLDDYYVKTYKLRYSLDGKNWIDYSSPNKVCAVNSINTGTITLGKIPMLSSSQESDCNNNCRKQFWYDFPKLFASSSAEALIPRK